MSEFFPNVAKLASNASPKELQNKINELNMKSRSFSSEKMVQINRLLEPLASFVNKYVSLSEHYVSMIPKEKTIMPEQMGDYTQVSQPTKTVHDNKLAKYYSLIESAKSILSKVEILHPDIDKETIKRLAPRFQQILFALQEFNRNFPPPLSGEAATISQRINNLLTQFMRYTAKMGL